MAYPSEPNISQDVAIENRSRIDAKLVQESAGKGDNTVHGQFSRRRQAGHMPLSLVLSGPQTARIMTTEGAHAYQFDFRYTHMLPR